MYIDNRYRIGQFVYLAVGGGERGIVTRITVNGGGTCVYEVAWGLRGERGHYDFELSAEPVLEFDGGEVPC